MSNTLDRLKALNSKLEAKLNQKKGEGTSTTTTQPPVEETRKVVQEVNRTPAKETVILRGQTPKDLSVDTQEATQSEEERERYAQVRRLSQILFHYLGINTSKEPVRGRNLERLSELYLKLEIEKKAPDIQDLFIYKAMNISGIGLKEEDFGEIREGKYVQVIAITYEPDKNGKKKAKNISLGYFGKAEGLDPSKKNEVIEFVLRWRYEKAFQNLEHYRHLLEKVCPKESLF